MKLRTSAFSLVEVILSLGLISFCMLSVLGLLPVGLKSVKNAREESAAANALNGLAAAIRDAGTNASGGYVAGGDFTNIVWTGTNTTNINGVLSLSGILPQRENGEGEARLAYQVDIVPQSADKTTPGRAHISVCWPATAVWSGKAWNRSEGSVSTGIQFLPR